MNVFWKCRGHIIVRVQQIIDQSPQPCTAPMKMSTACPEVGCVMKMILLLTGRSLILFICVFIWLFIFKCRYPQLTLTPFLHGASWRTLCTSTPVRRLPVLASRKRTDCEEECDFYQILLQPVNGQPVRTNAPVTVPELYSSWHTVTLLSKTTSACSIIAEWTWCSLPQWCHHGDL